MKTILFFVFAFQCFFYSYSQEFETVIRAKDFLPPCSDTNSSFGYDIINGNNCYFLLSEERANDDSCIIANTRPGYAISRLNQLGDTLFKKTFMHPNTPNDFYAPEAFYMSTDSAIFVVGTHSNKFFLARHNTQGDLIWRNSYSSPEKFKPTTILIDQNLVFVGGKKKIINSSESQAGIVLLDTSGTQIWSELTDMHHFDMIESIVKRENDYVLVGNYEHGLSFGKDLFVLPFDSLGISDSLFTFADPNDLYLNPDAIFSYDNKLIIGTARPINGDALIIEVDSNNNISNQIVVESDSTLYWFRFKQIVQTIDSNYVIFSDKAHVSTANSSLQTSICIQKVNQNGDTLWGRNYSGTANRCLRTSDGGVVLVGTRYNQLIATANHTSSLVLKTDSLGNSYACQPQFLPFLFDSISPGWAMPLYNTSYGEEEEFDWYVNGVNDPSLTIFSESIEFADTGWYQISLVGCQQEFSDSIYVHDYSASISENLDDGLKIYPNPVTNVIHIEIPKDGVEVNIRNLEGRLLYQETSAKYQEVNIETWPPGVYLVQIRMDSNFFMRRIVKL